MNYKGKVIDTSIAPITSTGKSVKESTHFDFTEDDNHTNMRDYFKNENESDDAETSD